MDIQKENNLIQEAFEVEADEVGFCLDRKWGDYENPYENSDTALAFNLFKKGWQAAKAKAVPDGFVVVPKEPTDEILKVANKILIAAYELRISNNQCLKRIYQAMIEAQGPAND